MPSKEQKARFLTALAVLQVTEDDWQLQTPLVYWSVFLNRKLTVPAGFITDFASVPRMPFIYWFAGGATEAPAVLHDWFYRTCTLKVSRKQADDLLYEAIVARGYSRFRGWLMWAGVRVGGYWSYETRDKHSTERFSDD